MAKRVLLIAAEFPPCGGGGVGRPFHLAAALSAQCFDVTVLTAAEDLYRVKNHSLDPNSINITTHRVEAPNVEKTFIRLSRFLPRFAPADRYFVWRRLAAFHARKLHRKKPFDLVVSTYPSFSNHAIAFSLSERFNVPWIADYRDPPRWMYIPGRKVERAFFAFAKRATHHVVTTAKTKRLISDRLHIPDHTFSVLRNGCDELAATLDVSQQTHGEFQILHTGSFYPEGRDINKLLKSASRLEHPIHLRFIGDPPSKETLKLVGTLKSHVRVSFDDFMPSDDVLKESAKSNALLVIQGELFENQVPGKIFEYLALQKPVLVITNKDSATYDIAKDEANVVIAEYGNEDDILDGLKKILTHTTHNVDRLSYTRQLAMQQYVELIDSILNGSHTDAHAESLQ